MQTLSSSFSLRSTNTAAFDFAGFTWPRFVATLPAGGMGKRLARYKNPMTGPYYHAPVPNGRGKGFYLGSQGTPGLRWDWCDELLPAIRHKGWFSDEHCENETIRGLVFRLPSGRGFLAGWSMGEGMCGTVEYDIYDAAEDAARAADGLAEVAAEKQREYEAAECLDDVDYNADGSTEQ